MVVTVTVTESVAVAEPVAVTVAVAVAVAVTVTVAVAVALAVALAVAVALALALAETPCSSCAMRRPRYRCRRDDDAIARRHIRPLSTSSHGDRGAGGILPKTARPIDFDAARRRSFGFFFFSLRPRAAFLVMVADGRPMERGRSRTDRAVSRR